MPVITQGRNPAEFILSEANGQRSRAGAVILNPAVVRPGMILKRVAATTDAAENYVQIAAAGEGDAIAMYAAAPAAGDDAAIAVIVRDAEVNGHLLEWPGGFDAAAKTTNMARLATLGILVRN